MTNNRFNLEAAKRGREFYLQHPNATGPQVDDASPKFNPARRHFQDAFYAEKYKNAPTNWWAFVQGRVGK